MSDQDELKDEKEECGACGECCGACDELSENDLDEDEKECDDKTESSRE